MLVNLSKIMSTKGKVEHILAPLELKTFQQEGTDYAFGEVNPVELTITHLGDKRVSIEASTNLTVLIPCSRCLDDVETKFDIHVSKELDFNESDEDRIKELDEANYVKGFDLDVDQMIYDEILIDFPISVLCKEDCKGFCNVCGMNLNHGTCSCESTSLDPRMAAIRDIFNNFKEV
ncbi:clustered with ribosomal protein L32p [Lachnospiraceae bacterium KM106-2]|nr:clustered with ribosomal protein L32p [Lachnospiraceae bacterium KM106-2]